METFVDMISAPQPVVVDFYAEWCAPCRTMSGILKQVKDCQGDEVRIIKLDIDKNPSLALHYSVQAVPTLMIFKNGRQLWRQSGVMDARALNQIVEMMK